ncbi:MAG: CAAX prenyl protease-related protein [Thermodesulfobacteriota bacterium]|nr:CAAX prenyl protease-related protein [Thermodesulfobacteriota bacterium]
MTRFYHKTWFPYVAPFLLYFSISEATKYLPEWFFHLYLTKILLTGGLLWAWRQKLSIDLKLTLTRMQTTIALGFGMLGVLIWIVADQLQWITLPASNIPTHWPLILEITVTTLFLLGFSLIMPIMSELFWRSFMLRYLIVQDFKSQPIGSFQFFSFFVVVVLTALPSEYVIAVALISILQNTLMVWQKNLLCCIVASIITHSLLAIYLLLNNQQWL